ncbi:MAG: hypothetical protein ACPKOI_01300 [Pleomorphochaeta sp.]
MYKVKFMMGPSDCNDENIPKYSEDFIKELSEQLSEEVVYASMDEIAKEALPIYFIASGGAERDFSKNYKKTKGKYILLTTPAYNSLASALEILGFLHEQGLEGEIIHGSMQLIAKRLKVLKKVSEAKIKMASMRLGCFGKPDGLLSSEVNEKDLKNTFGMEIVHLDLEELINEYNIGGYDENEYTKDLKTKDFNKDEIEKALNVYGALTRLIKKYNLAAISVKCFELLGKINTTGCLALAILNAQGIPAACEGDQKALVSMTIAYLITGNPGFMANPNFIDSDTKECVIAHCTLPLNMPDSYSLTTHFESGIGVAITSDIKSQPLTIFKSDGGEKYFAHVCSLEKTMHRNDLCRSQMTVKIDDYTFDYLMNNPISNHHIFVLGDWVEEFNELYK